MKTALLSALALSLIALAPAALANELDNDAGMANAKRYAADLPQTVVIKATKDGQVSVLQSKELLAAGVKVPEGVPFTPVKTVKDQAGAPRGELDRDSSSGDWYFFVNNYSPFNWGLGYNNFFYPSYNYFGFNYGYRPYYNYFYNNAFYSYYRWF